MSDVHYRKPFNPHQYAIDGGWDASHIDATARLGVSDEDIKRLRAYYGPGAGDRYAEQLAEWCKAEWRKRNL